MSASLHAMRFQDLVPVLQIAIGPVILISGVGLLLLSMTNCLGRIVDRSWRLSGAFRDAPPQQRGHLSSQLRILSTRAQLVRLAITLAALSALSASFLIIAPFLIAILQLEMALLVILLFTACLLSLIGSLVIFIRDVNLSLAALRLEIASVDDSAT